MTKIFGRAIVSFLSVFTRILFTNFNESDKNVFPIPVVLEKLKKKKNKTTRESR